MTFLVIGRSLSKKTPSLLTGCCHSHNFFQVTYIKTKQDRPPKLKTLKKVSYV